MVAVEVVDGVVAVGAVGAEGLLGLPRQSMSAKARTMLDPLACTVNQRLANCQLRKHLQRPPGEVGAREKLYLMHSSPKRKRSRKRRCRRPSGSNHLWMSNGQ